MENGALAKIINILINRFEEGFPIDNDTLHFLESSYGICSDEIEGFLINKEDPLIYELIIYPDEKLKAEIEAFIPEKALSEEEETLLKQTLLNAISMIKIKFCDKEIFIPAKDLRENIATYINRLRLNLNLNFITQELEDLDREILYKVRAIFRAKFFDIDQEKALFLCTIVKKIAQRESNFEEIKKIIKIIEDVHKLIQNEKGEILDILSYKKDYYESVLLQHENFKKLSKSYSMEFMMSQKIQPPIESVDVASYYIGLINKVVLLVFGTILPGQSSRDIEISSEDFINGIY